MFVHGKSVVNRPGKLRQQRPWNPPLPEAEKGRESERKRLRKRESVRERLRGRESESELKGKTHGEGKGSARTARTVFFCIGNLCGGCVGNWRLAKHTFRAVRTKLRFGNRGVLQIWVARSIRARFGAEKCDAESEVGPKKWANNERERERACSRALAIARQFGLSQWRMVYVTF